MAATLAFSVFTVNPNYPAACYFSREEKNLFTLFLVLFASGIQLKKVSDLLLKGK
jgi:hypothetical protein